MSETDENSLPDGLPGIAPPEHCRELRGHGRAQEMLGAMLSQGRLPGALLFHGPQGIGKASLAFIAARAILKATSDEPDQRIDEQVRAGAHPNLFVLRRTMNAAGTKFSTRITVDQIAKRQDGDSHPLGERLRRTRGRAGHRIVIVDSIDDCNDNSANALLKILEEPPPDTSFMLISHRPGQLLPTIRSRSRPMALRPLDDADVARVLRAGAPDAASEAIARAVALADGRPRRGFEALALEAGGPLEALGNWLTGVGHAPVATHLALAAALAGDWSTPTGRFARDMIMGWMAGEARAAAIAPDRLRLASANELWEKAQAIFADADSFNLDPRQTLVVVFDAMKQHARRTASVPSEPS